MLLLKGILCGALVSFISVSADLYTASYVLTRNWIAGFIASLGLVLVQIIWSVIAIFTLRISIKTLHTNLRELILFGCLILIIMAVRLYRRERRRQKNIPIRPSKLKNIFFEAIIFALGAPGKILAYVALFITLGIEKNDPSRATILPLIIGVALGGLLWWLIYIFIINSGRHRISQAFVSRMQKLAAIIVVCFAIYGIITAFTKF
jgi:threonine/homoserine/homoserine lactone efflux protein